MVTRAKFFSAILCGFCSLSGFVAHRAKATVSTITWISPASGLWDDTNNWSTHTLPGPTNNVIIDVPEAITVTHRTGNTFIHSLQSSENIVLSGGTLTVSITVQVNNSFTISGGTLKSATVLSGANGEPLAVSSGTLDGVTVNGDLDLTGGNGVNATIVNGLVLNGTARLGNTNGTIYGGLSFNGTQTLSGNGTVVFGRSVCNAVRVASGGTTLTLGPGVTVRGHSGQMGYDNQCQGGSSSVGVVNQGTISADVAGGTITLNAQPFTNQGVIKSPGGALNVGLLDNTAGTLVADADTGPLNLVGGTIRGGTIVTTDGAAVRFGSGTLDGVTVDGDLDLTGGIGVNATIVNGLVLNGTARLGNTNGTTYGGLSFSGTQTLSGNGTVVLGHSVCNAVRVVSGGTTLKLGPGITVRGHSGQMGYDNQCQGGSPSVGVVNQGTISADVAGGTITLNAQPFTNQGVIKSPGGALNVGLLDNTAGTLVADADTGPLNLVGGTIRGGMIVTTDGAAVRFGSGTLDGVTVNGDLDLTGGNGVNATIVNGLVLNGTARLGNTNGTTYGGLIFSGTQTLSGNGTVVFGRSVCNAVRVASGGTTLTLGPGITVRGHSGQMGYDNQCQGGSSSVGVVNQGTISVDVAGGAITVHAQPFINVGVLEAKRGVLIVAGEYTPAGGTLSVGINSSTDYGRIRFSRPLVADDRFSVSTQNVFRPNPGERFQVLSYPSAAYDLSCYIGLDLGAGVFMVPQIGKTGLTLATTGYETNGLPSLFVVRSPGGVRVLWTRGFPDWTLESNTNLRVPDWGPVPGADCEDQVVSPITTREKYFRLRREFRPTIVQITHNGVTANISFTTLSGFNYTVEFKDTLDGAVWTPVPEVAGTGAVVTVSDPSASTPTRFYRVRAE